MKARIYDMDGESYVVTCEADCRDETDLSAYKEAVDFNDVITMGRVVVEPL